jgi:adenylate cyclase class 2
MGFEVEIKFRVANHEDLRERLAAMAAQVGPPIDQEDAYLAHPGRDFAQTDEALRVRKDGSENWITYKGPKRGGPTKTREEIDIRFSDGDEPRQLMTRLFERLSFIPVLTVRKRRETYGLLCDGRHVAIVLDLSPELGAFAEVETLAAAESDLPEAQAAVLALAAKLGLTEVEPRSYLRMALELRTGERGPSTP